VRQGLALWSFVARRPRLYRRLTALANRLLATFGRADGRYRQPHSGLRVHHPFDACNLAWAAMEPARPARRLYW